MVTKTIANFWKENLLILCLTTIESGGIILSTVYLSKIMNSLIMQNRNSFFIFFFISLFLWFIALVAGFLKSLFVEKVKQKQVLYLRDKLVQTIANKSYEAFYVKQINEYISWLTTDMNTLEEHCFENFYLALSSFTLLIFSAIAIFKFHYLLLLITILAALIMTLIPNNLRKKLDSKNITTSKVNEKYISKIDEWIKGFPTLITYNKASLLKKVLGVQNQKLADVKMDLGKTNSSIHAIIRSLSVIFQYIIIFVTGILILSGMLSAGVIFSIGDLTGNFFGNMSYFINQITSFLSTSKIIHKINFDPHTEAVPCTQNKEKISFNQQIEVKNVVYTYPNKKKISMPNMTFLKGGKYALIGKSGAGKTTFLNILAKNLSYSNGSITLDHQDINYINPIAYRNTLSYITQKSYIFDLNLQDNITLFETPDKKELQKLIRNIDLTDLENYESLGLFGKNISGGQAQRVEIGRSLIQKKEILLIDEGTSNLDKHTAYIIEKELLTNPHLTVIFVTHHLNPKLENLFTKIYEF